MSNPEQPTHLKKETLGKIASALLPIEKVKAKSPRGLPFEREVHNFLIGRFNGYTVNSGTISGHWKDDTGKDHYGEHREYRVAVPNDDAIHALEAFLSALARDLDEVCIYLEVAGEIRLIYRTPV